MGGFVIDIVLDFLARIIARFLDWSRSSRWDRKTARVVNATATDDLMGCTVVKVCYQIDSETCHPERTEDIPFLLIGSARQYASEFSENPRIIIRINPENAEESRFFESDQMQRKAES
jgi:hypothetical protein